MVAEEAAKHPDKPVEVWATDEHHIGLKPIIRRVWAPKGQRPVALGHHHYKGLSGTAFVQPISGETFWYISNGISKPFFVPQVEPNTVALVERLDEAAELRSEHSLHRALVGGDHVHLDTARPQSARDFEADEARAEHDGGLGVLRPLDNGPAVGQRAQGEDVRLRRRSPPRRHQR